MSVVIKHINTWPATNPTTALDSSQRPSISSITWFPQLDIPSYFMPTDANKLEEANVHHTGGYGKINSKTSQSIYSLSSQDRPKGSTAKAICNSSQSIHNFSKVMVVLLHSEQDTCVLPVLWRHSVWSMPWAKAAGPGTWVWPAGGLVVCSPTWISIDMAQW